MARNLIGNVYPTDEYLLARCAPAGYGLGASVCAVPTDADANNIGRVGFYQCTKHTPVENENWYIIHLSHVSGTYEHQIAVRVTDGSRAERTKINGVWGEWERVNPPMTPDVEYRTTERYMGKPVYTKLVNVGAYPETGMTNAKTGIIATGIVRFHASIGYTSLPLAGNMEINTFHTGEEITVQLHTKGERIYSSDVLVSLYYIKN